MLDFLLASLNALPVGVILVDADGSVRAWNRLAEEFIEAVGRPTLHEGMTMNDAHPEQARRAVAAMVAGLESGKQYSGKIVRSNNGEARTFQVSYNRITGTSGEFIGVAQVISHAPGTEDAS